MQEQKFIESFNAALEGFIYVLRNERNMRIHFLSCLFFIILGVYLNFDYLELLVLCITITLVLVAEMINTVVEYTIDIVKSDIHPLARVIKDIAAGVVLLTAINAVIVGYLLFSKRLPFDIETAMSSVKQSPWHITFISLIIVFGASVIGKVLFHKGTPLRGGMPSGHAAVAFSIWTIIVFLTANPVVVALAFLMAFLLARHRLKDAVHTFWEVLAGGILGVLLTALVFQLLR